MKSLRHPPGGDRDELVWSDSAQKGRKGTGELEERRGAGEILLVVTPILLPVHTQTRMSAHDLCWPGTVSQLLSIPECPSTPGRRGELWVWQGPTSVLFYLSLS